jgi:hypothetical protein
MGALCFGTKASLDVILIMAADCLVSRWGIMSRFDRVKDIAEFVYF